MPFGGVGTVICICMCLVASYERLCVCFASVVTLERHLFIVSCKTRSIRIWMCKIVSMSGRWQMRGSLVKKCTHIHPHLTNMYTPYKLLFLTCHCLQPLFKATFANASVVMLCSCGVAVRFWLWLLANFLSTTNILCKYVLQDTYNISRHWISLAFAMVLAHSLTFLLFICKLNASIQIHTHAYVGV